MKTTLLLASIGAALLVGLVVGPGFGAEEKNHKLTSVSPRKMADALHAVIAADRQVYAELIVQRLAFDTNKIGVGENWREDRCLPVPAQLLRTAGVNIQKQGAEFSYALRSLWPINPNHSPQTMLEEIGLDEVRRRPNTNVYREELLGGRSYFTAIYPDLATLPSCAQCHNQHPNSPRRDFKQNDVMGAIVIRVPLEF